MAATRTKILLILMTGTCKELGNLYLWFVLYFGRSDGCSMRKYHRQGVVDVEHDELGLKSASHSRPNVIYKTNDCLVGMAFLITCTPVTPNTRLRFFGPPQVPL